MEAFKGCLDFGKISFFHALLMRLIALMIAEVSAGEYINSPAVIEWTDELLK